MSRTLLLAGSPRGRLSSSGSLAVYLSTLLQDKGQETEVLWISEHLVNEERTEQMLEAVQRADSIVVTAPLYDDCQPYIVTKTMELMESLDLGDKQFIPIINCGFPQVEQISYAAIPIYRMFAAKTGMDWLGSLAIGGGGGLLGETGKPLGEVGGAAKIVIAELQKIADAITTDAGYLDTEAATIPKFLLRPSFGRVFAWMNNRAWKAMAKKNGKKVDSRPYAK